MGWTWCFSIGQLFSVILFGRHTWTQEQPSVSGGWAFVDECLEDFGFFTLTKVRIIWYRTISRRTGAAFFCPFFEFIEKNTAKNQRTTAAGKNGKRNDVSTQEHDTKGLPPVLKWKAGLSQAIEKLNPMVITINVRTDETEPKDRERKGTSVRKDWTQG